MQRAHAALGVGIALVAFALYARTAAPTITWLNGGTDPAELVTASYTLGIAHPPGYPLYVLLGKAWSLLPLDGDVAYRYNLFSALCGALAAALVALLTLHLCRRSQTVPGDPATSGAQDRASLLAAAVAGLSLTAAPAFWAQATVAEVYTLHALLLTVALGLLLAWSARQAASGRVGLLALASLSVGLALGNHLTTVFLVPLGLAYTGAVGWRTVSVRGWLIVVLAFLLGLVVYAYLPLRAAHDPVANWGDPSTPERFLQHITGAEY